jgi:hypothetical protein
MARDQNTVAKRQREMEKKRKAEEKRERRAKKKNETDESSGPNTLQSSLSVAEQSVLGVFRKYLMLPGKMLCLTSVDVETFKLPLAQLIKDGLLVSEKYQGGYSLTEVGFVAMRDGQ